MKEITQEELINMMEDQAENVYTTCFFEDINEESVSKFIDRIERQIRTIGVSELRVEFSSNGGEAPSAMTLIRYLNNLSDDGVTVVLTASFALYSAASMVFLKSKVFKIITPETLMLLHTPLYSVRTRQKESRDLIHSLQEDSREKYIKEIKESGILSEEEIKKLKDGRDVYLNSDRLHNYMTETDGEYYLGRTGI